MRRTLTFVAIAAAALLLLLAGMARAESNPLTYHREELPGGAVLLVKESRQLPMVTIRVSQRAGARYEPPAKAGLAEMTSSLLTRGAAGRSASDIEETHDRLGGGVEASAGRIHAVASLRVLTRDLEEGMALLADVLRRPTFPAKEIAKTRQRTLGRLRQMEERPGHLANTALRRALFGTRAAGRIPEGTPETVKKIRRADIVEFHKKRYGMKGAIFAFVGDISPQRARELVESRFSGWQGGGGEAPDFEEPAPPEGMKVIKIDRSFAQTTVMLGNRSLTRKNPDFYPARVMNYILGGGGFDSRILNNIREEKGLVYAAYSYFASGLYTGHWRLMLQTKNKSANQAISESIAEIRRIQNEGVTDEELADAKAFITGNFATRFGSSRRIAEYIVAIEQLGFPPDYPARYLEKIRAVTKEQVQATARKYIQLDHAVLTVVGDLKEAQIKY